MPTVVSGNLKKRALEGFFTRTGAALKVALYVAALNPTGAMVTRATQHESAGGNYNAGGVAVTNVAVAADGDFYRLTFDNVEFTNLGSGSPVTWRYAMLYDSALSVDNVAVIYDSGGDNVVSGDNEILTFGTGSNAPLSI